MFSSSGHVSARHGWPLALAGAAVFFGFTVLMVNVVGLDTLIRSFAALPPAVATVLIGAIGALVGAALAGVVVRRSVRYQLNLLSNVLDNLSQAVCVVDRTTRMIFQNRSYIELCKLPADRFWPGRPLRDLLEERRSVGTFSGDVDVYVGDCVRRVSEGQTSQVMLERNGRMLSLLERPMPGGGWVATQEDITERHKAERERNAMLEQQQRRTMIDSAIHEFRTHVEAMLKTVTENAAAMRGTATTLLDSSHQTSERIEIAVKTSNEASVNVESAALAADELSSSIAEISRQLTQTNDVVHSAASDAQATHNEIGGLATAARKIGDVVKMIQDIAGQTNLLALNATIEAARAGEAGRGFAVVASEVKSLAVQTAKATEDISGQIAAVQNSSTEVVEAIRLLADRMQEINRYSSAVAASLQQQNAATGEITQNVTGAARGSRAIVSTLGEVVGAATETRKSAQTVLTASEAVEAAAENLRSEVQSFLRRVAV